MHKPALFKLHQFRYDAATPEDSPAEKAKQTMENVYENIRERFDSVMLKMRGSLQSPRYRELIFYVLLSMLPREGFQKQKTLGSVFSLGCF